jgi:phosphoglycolate phosphatase
MSYYIFDFDGTICDTFDVTLSIMNGYFKRLGKNPVTATGLRTKGIEALIKEYKLNSLQLLLWVHIGRRELTKHINDLKTFPHLKEVLNMLSQTNTLGIVSTNSGKNIKKFLKNNDLENTFKFVKTSPVLMNKFKVIQKVKQDIKTQTSDIYYIGDEIRDIKAARTAGVKSVSVTWGFEGKKLLSENHPDYLITTPNELLRLH